MLHHLRHIGVDVSMGRLDVFIEPDGEAFHVSNDAAGYAQLIARMRPGDAVGCEASGGHEAGLLIALQEAGHPKWCLHPADVRTFSRLIGRRAKTDPLDARAIAGALQVAARSRPPLIVTRSLKSLRDLLTLRHNLVARLSEVKSLLTSIETPAARTDLEAERDGLTGRIKVLEAALADALEADDEAAARKRLLATLPGVGPILAAHMIASLPELGTANARQIASLVGVAPHPRQSGTGRRPGGCQGGRARLRRVLYMAVLSTVRVEGPFRAAYQRLRAAGKPHKVAAVAIMRKLVVTANAMVKSGTCWKPMQPG